MSFVWGRLSHLLKVFCSGGVLWVNSFLITAVHLARCGTVFDPSNVCQLGILS